MYQDVPNETFATSARFRQLASTLHAPITETPFDCFGEDVVNAAYLTEDLISDVGFMACFGRPLWRGLAGSYSEHALKAASRGEALPVEEEKRYGESPRFSQYKHLLRMATAKLVHNQEWDFSRLSYSETAQTAVLDVRLMLSFKAGWPPAHQREMALVADHMRTLYSIPEGREYLRSGYSSEPILAEAAARLLHQWRTDKSAFTGGGDPAVTILKENVDHDLLERGEIGEVVARLLLLLSRDRASALDCSSGIPHFARSLPAETFFEQLLSDDVAKQFLDSKPDNLMVDDGSKTLREAFKDARINFTHFAKAAGDSALSQSALLACFARGMAFIVRNDGPSADIAIPVLLRRGKTLSEWFMTAVLVQVKRRVVAGGAALYSVRQEDVGLFPPDDTSAVDGALRPYVTLIMDLDGRPPSSLVAQTPTDYSPEKAYNLRRNMTKSEGLSGVRHSRDRHPRYSLYIAGCSPTVYAVISEAEHKHYRAMLQKGDLLAEHPRQDPLSLSITRRQKPFFGAGAGSWDWILSKELNPTQQPVVIDGAYLVGLSEDETTERA